MPWSASTGTLILPLNPWARSLRPVPHSWIEPCHRYNLPCFWLLLSWLAGCTPGWTRLHPAIWLLGCQESLLLLAPRPCSGSTGCALLVQTLLWVHSWLLVPLGAVMLLLSPDVLCPVTITLVPFSSHPCLKSVECLGTPKSQGFLPAMKLFL